MQPFEERVKSGRSAGVILADLQQRLSTIQGAFIITIPPPPVSGIGNAGGFKMMIQDKRGRGPEVLEAAVQDMIGAANQIPGLVGVRSEEHTSELQSLMRISYAVFCLKKKKQKIS